MKCATIGHSNYPAERFLALLRKSGITDIVDVRSSPYSRAVPHFDRERLRPYLEANGIKYHYMGTSLGARNHDKELLFPDGRVDFSKVRERPAFISALSEVISLIAEGKQVALMCSEKEPYDCHRFVLISYALQKKGIKVEHILEDGSRVPNSELEKRLKKEYAQRDLFSFNEAESASLDKLYERRNKAIAYRASE
jgi:uncharacterized protein (DUF488 family)